jgi:rod shape-determining protein MreC
VALQLQAVENRQLRKLYELNTTLDLDQYAPVQARVSGRLGGRLPTQVRIDRGEVAGIRAGQPVVDGDGLVGRVTTVAPAYAIVSLIDHETFGTGAFVSGKEIKATVKASATRGGELELTLVNASLILRGDIVYTSGSSSDDTPSFYPRGLPVGRVVAVETGDGNLDSRVRVRPVSDLVNLDRVEVLTTP